MYFGHHAYGIASAARAYFDVDPSHLRLAQASLLAGLIQSPSAYDPFVNPSGARLRQIAVLRSMVRNGFITVADGTRVLGPALALRGGDSMPGVSGVSLSPGPMFSYVELGAGALVLLMAPGVWWTWSRFRPPGMAAVAVAGSLVVAGCLVLARSLRFA